MSRSAGSPQEFYAPDYVDAGQDYYNQQYRARIIKNMQKKAKMLGFQSMPIQLLTTEVP